MSDRYLPVGGRVPPLHACNDCGLILWSKEKHDTWHDSLVQEYDGE